ncbi:MAG: hypothetical protein JWQ63_4372 [Mucilaginibacter sp.]|nr:hypothetical protein [Mucilaginibacter sp.]
MAFRDFPKIDKASVNSDKSDTAVLGILSQANGFICRRDVPDKGCDLDAELIIAGTNASNWRFGIQLKSVEQLTLVADGTMISYAFETSRLGYLLNRPIGSGMVVIYDVQNGQLYYDYAEKIYMRLIRERQSDDWLDNDSVNIHFPIINSLNDATAKHIHEKFTDNFKKASLILASQGPRYDYPAIPLQETQFDLNNPENVTKLLLEFGFSLMRTHDINLLYGLIITIPSATIDQHPELMVMAAVVYGEVGKRYDSEHYIHKLTRRGKIPNEHRQLIGFTHLKNQLALNQMDIPEFIQAAKLLRKDALTLQNEVLLDLNIIFYELLVPKFYHLLPEGIHERIKETFEKIQQLKTDDQGKRLLEVWNAENLASLIGYYRLKQLNQLAIQRAMGMKNKSSELVRESNMLADLQQELYTGLERLYNIGKDTEDKLLQAYSVVVRSRYVLTQELDLISQMPILSDVRFHNETMFINSIALCLSATDVFREFNYHETAYQCLCYGLELINVSRSFYHYADQFSLDHLNHIKSQMEASRDVQVYEMLIPELLARIERENKENIERPMFVVKNLDDEQIKNMAYNFSEALSLPKEYLTNIIAELKGYRTFYQRCNNNYEIIEAPKHPRLELSYRQPTKFIIRDKVTGISSLPVQNVDAFLNSWGI